jgi:methionyl-tRNA formyltransferase
MRFAITATDRYLGILETLLERGWTPLKIFTTTVDDRIHHNSALIEFARRLNVEAQISRLSDENLRQLGQQGCEALVVASYRWRIGDWRPHLRHAVNFHPSPLPRGRGPYPAPAAILEEAPSWGVACHKLEHGFDAGDILKTLEFPLSRHEDHDSLDLRIQLAARRLSADVADHFDRYWEAATPQSGGSYHPMWTAEDRSLDFSQTVEQLLRRLRAFGPLECIARLNKTVFYVRRAVGWTEAHRTPVGTVVYINSLAMVVAAADGFIGLTEWSLIDAAQVTGTLRR